MKTVLMFVLVVLLLPVLFPLFVLGGWMFTTDKARAKSEIAQ